MSEKKVHNGGTVDIVPRQSIIVTGACGYVGRAIVRHLKGKYDIVEVCRGDVDLTNRDEVRKFLTTNYHTAIIHCAIEGGSRLKVDDANVLYNNLLMFSNIMEFALPDAKIINIGSGAEYDRRNPIQPDKPKLTIPTDPYGMSKYFIAQQLRGNPNGYNLRIFGVFDRNESETRFIKTAINSTMRGEVFNVLGPLEMSFIYMDDFIWMLERAINDETNGVREFDCVYPNDPKNDDLTEIADYICEKDILGGRGYEVVVNKGPWTYLGTAPDWVDYSKLIGLRGGIDETYKQIKSRITWHE